MSAALPLPKPALSRAVVHYTLILCVGLVAIALSPAARGTHAWLGWLPFWLVCTPALVLAQLGDARQLVVAIARRARPRRVQARRYR